MIKRLKWFFPLIMLIFLFQCQKSGGKLSGKVIGADGKPPVIAHVHVVEAGGNVFQPLKSVQTKKDGTFEIELPDNKYLTLYITAAFHQHLQVPLVRKTKDQSLQMDFQLNSYKFKNTFDQVKITGDWNNFAFSTAQPMKKQADGTFTFDVHPQADTVAYQLIGLTNREISLNGTEYDYLVYDHGGDYRSVLRKKDSLMHIVFDPQKLPRIYNDALPKVLLKSGDIMSQDLMDVKLLIDRYLNNWKVAKQRYIQQFGTDKGFKFDFSELLKALEQKQEQSESREVRNYIDFQRVLLAQYGAQLDDAVIKKLAQNVPPTDPIWALNPQILPFILEKTYGQKKATTMLENAVDKIENKTTRAFILVRLGMEAKAMHNDQKVAKIYNQLKNDYSDIYFVKFYLKMLNPEARVAVGKPVPDFSFKEMDTGKEISNKTLKGKFYIMDFWAVWCKPCLGELPYMSKAYDRYKNKNFTILSISFDRSPDDVRKFRQGKFKMPWLHVYLDKTIRNQVAEEFEVSGIPKPILVSPEGVIIAMENDLRGEKLDVTLRKYLE